MNRTLAIAAFVLAFVALVVAVDARIHSRQVAEAVLHAREEQVVDHFWPEVQALVHGAGAAQVPDDSPQYGRPDTIEGLLAPLFEVVDVAPAKSAPGESGPARAPRPR